MYTLDNDSKGGSRRMVFLDRDGTINQDSPDYIKSPAEFSFLPGAFAAMRRLAGLGIDVIVVTNQGVIGRQMVEEEVIDEINRQMVEEIECEGGNIAGVYLCPHAPWMGCACRKPEPGMLSQASQDYGIDLSRSFMVGDKESDVEAGKAAGCLPILLSPDCGPSAMGGHRPDGAIVASNLYQATQRIENVLTCETVLY